MKYDIKLTVTEAGKTAKYVYMLKDIATRGGAAGLIKTIYRKYYDTLCAVHSLGSVRVSVIGAGGAEICHGSGQLNVFNSDAIFTFFEPLALPEPTTE